MAEYTRGLFAEEKWASARDDVGLRSGTRARARRTPNRSGRGRPIIPRWELAWPSRPVAGAARRAPPIGPRTAFVLSGGGNQGVSQVGMLRALLEREIVPDVVIGTSAGALNGAAIVLRAEPHRRRAARRGVGAAPQRPRVPRRAAPPGVERRAPRHPPLRQRGPRSGHPPQHARPVRSPTSRSRCA